MNKLCDFCGAEFKPYRPSKDRYCSAQCKRDHYNMTRRAKYVPVTYEPKLCVVCHEPFTPPAHSGKIKVYCSVRCQQRASEERQKQKRRAVAHYCQYCGEPFVLSKKHLRHCSVSCGKSDRQRRYWLRTHPNAFPVHRRVWWVHRCKRGRPVRLHGVVTRIDGPQRFVWSNGEQYTINIMDLRGQPRRGKGRR